MFVHFNFHRDTAAKKKKDTRKDPRPISWVHPYSKFMEELRSLIIDAHLSAFSDCVFKRYLELGP